MKHMRSLIILTLLLGVLVWFLVRGSGRGQFESLGRALGPVAFLEVTQREGRFDGTVEARNVQLIANRQQHLRSLYFDQVVLHTPGVWHLLSTPFGTPNELPEVFSMDFNRMRGQPLPIEDEAGNVWFNFKSLVPFDGLACRDSGELQDSDFGGMQLVGGATNIGLRHTFDNGLTTVELSWDNGNFAQLQLKAELESFSLERWLSQRLDVADAAVRSVTITLDVGDYPAKRNAYCAKLRVQSEEEFIEANLALTREFLNSHGVTVEDRLWQSWREFTRKGGSITLRSDYGNALRLSRLRDKSLSERFDLLRLRINTGSGEVPLRFQDFILPTLEISAVAPPLEPGQTLEAGEQAPAGDAGTATVVDESVEMLSRIGSGRAASARLKPTAAAAAVVAAKPQPVTVRRGPQEVSYAEIGNWIGRDLVFVLDNGMRYRGRPRAVTANDVRLDVIMRGGTAGMTLSKARIRRVLVY
jgi:hypothetical protein